MPTTIVFRPRLLVAGILLAGLAVFTGCNTGHTGATVSGTVTIDGKLANAGRVTFTSASGAAISGEIQPDGTYHVVGVTPGEFKVSVTNPPAGAVPSSKAPPPGAKDLPGGPPVTNPVPIPWKYAKAESSGLTSSIKDGDNNYNVELKSK